MTYQPQRFNAPDGTELVVLPAADYDRLLDLAEDGGDIAQGRAQLARIADGEGTMPDEVLGAILDGETPLAAWRRYCGISQAELARRAGLSQAWVGRIEAGNGHGTPSTRARLAVALDAPAWALEQQTGETDMQPRHSSGKGAKYAPLLAHLSADGRSTVTMRYDDIARLVGGLPKSASLHRAWWGNHEGNSQAHGWMPAKYLAEPDMARRTVVFRKFTH